MQIRTLIVASLLIEVCLSATRGFFMPFGSVNGDTVLPPNDDGFSGQVNFGPFRLFGQNWNQLYVANNGALSLDRGLSSYQQVAFESVDPTMPKLIAPLFLDIDTRENSGTVSYRESSTVGDLANMTSFIRAAAAPSFTPTKIFIATWANCKLFGFRGTPETVSFQIVISVDAAANTFLLLNYGDLERLAGSATVGLVPGSAGFTLFDGQNYVTMPGSMTADVANLRDGSNININGVPQTGQWMFDISNVAVTSMSISTGAITTGVTTSVPVSTGAITTGRQGPRCETLLNETRIECLHFDKLFTTDHKFRDAKIHIYDCPEYGAPRGSCLHGGTYEVREFMIHKQQACAPLATCSESHIGAFGGKCVRYYDVKVNEKNGCKNPIASVIVPLDEASYPAWDKCHGPQRVKCSDDDLKHNKKCAVAKRDFCYKPRCGTDRDLVDIWKVIDEYLWYGN